MEIRTKSWVVAGNFKLQGSECPFLDATLQAKQILWDKNNISPDSQIQSA
jgi:hypothetical protein